MNLEILCYISLLLTNFLFLKNIKFFAQKINLYDYPNKKKIHKKKTPLIGGCLLAINIITYLSFNIYSNNKDIFFFKNNNEVITFFIIFIVIFIVGFLDDKKNLSPNFRFIFFSLVFLVLLYFHPILTIDELKFSSISRLITLGYWSKIFTILCFLIFLNACNMFDGINLQSFLYYLFFLLTILFKLNFSNFYIIIILSILFFGFLNRNGIIFFGNNGVYTISFILGYIIIKNYNLQHNLYVEQIFILMMYPGLDMIRLVIERILKRKHPFIGDKKHLHHILLNKFGYKKTIAYFAILIGITNLMMILNINSLMIIVLGIFTYFITLRNINYY